MNIKTIMMIGAAISSLAGATSASAQTVGVNAAIRNQVQIRTGADSAPRKAVLKERVSLGDDVSTGQASVLQILLLDKTTFTVGANARVKIDRFVYDPNRKASAVGASVAKGAFRFMSGKSLRGAPGQSSINTPVGSIGIRGTILEGAVGAEAVRIARGESAVGSVAADNDAATLIVLRGPGAATQGDEKPGAIDVNTAGQTISVDRPGLALFVPAPNARPIGPFSISDAGLLALHDLLRTTPDRRASSSAFSPESSPIVDFTFECEGFFEPVIIDVDPANPNAGSGSSSSSSSIGGCFRESSFQSPGA